MSSSQGASDSPIPPSNPSSPKLRDLAATNPKLKRAIGLFYLNNRKAIHSMVQTIAKLIPPDRWDQMVKEEFGHTGMTDSELKQLADNLRGEIVEIPPDSAK